MHFVLLRPTYPFPGTMTHNIYTLVIKCTTTPIVSFDSIRRGEGRARCAFYVKHNNNRLDAYMMVYNEEKRKI